ncbi:DUF4249 domain-containing protein [Flagellimonas sp. HMM57]|uniref:DUF4249 domain-containing protein n=1 Tax=unclassified Flagellimonas TaxID=2644544 RepID=UPI0013D48553|nr:MULTISPECIES: DUF4249 domain-containing protein [unclassified Flagellimonas]UII77756.1 DUF4249 domain-containing protein [Flagellimonas sp. HMM57]
MKTKTYLRTVLFVVLTTLTIACETVVTEDITLNGGEPRLVLDGGIERNTISPLAEQQIRLSSTIGFLDTEDPTPVTDAVVFVSDGTADYEFTHVSNGIYTNSSITASLDTQYTITIVWNGETYSGSDSLSEVVPFVDVYSEFEEETEFTEEGYFVKFDSQDPENEENFYYYRVFRNGEFVIVPDPGNGLTLVESDEFFDGQLRTGVNPNEEAVFEVGDIATAQQLGITNDYFNYLVELFNQTGNQGLSFIGNPPPASIRGNILNMDNPSNRALGYFYTVDVQEVTIEIVE